MSSYTQSIQNLIEQLASLPGIGNRSAERIAFHLLKQSTEEALRLADAIRDVKTKIRHCSICYNLTEADPCDLCTDPRRDQGLICVVEQPKDLLALESAGAYGGAYHVLLGHIAPLDAAGADELTIPALLDRVAGGNVREVILATNPTVDGDGTALFITEALKARCPGVTVSRLARGLPAGASIEYANRNILSDALTGRRQV